MSCGKCEMKWHSSIEITEHVGKVLSKQCYRNARFADHGIKVEFCFRFLIWRLKEDQVETSSKGERPKNKIDKAQPSLLLVQDGYEVLNIKDMTVKKPVFLFQERHKTH